MVHDKIEMMEEAVCKATKIKKKAKNSQVSAKLEIGAI